MKPCLKIFLSLGILFLTLSLVLRVQAQLKPVIYLTSSDEGIIRLDLDPPKPANAFLPINKIQHLALNLKAGKIYFTIGARKIMRANLDGTGLEELISSEMNGIEHIALDTIQEKIYYSDWGKKMIFRANLNGSQIDTLVESIPDSPNSIALDLSNGHMYWTDRGNDKIFRAKLDGSEIDTLINSNLGIPEGIALDVSAGKMYWVDQGLGMDRIERADLDGNNRETLVDSIRGCEGIDLDLTQKKMYWTDWATRKIQRANLDGSMIEDLVTTDINYPNTVALDIQGGKMYWTDFELSKIKSATLDGDSITEIIALGLSSPEGIALDIKSGKVYWADQGINKIQRSNLDGTQIEDLISQGLEFPHGIALDLESGKIYWTDKQLDKIQRANLDGTQVEDLITGLSDPNGIALDLQASKMYWTDGLGKKIQRANLDGSQAENLISGLGNPDGIALDLKANKIYWTDRATEKIHRARLDGTAMEDLVTGLSVPIGIALDTTAGKMYWTDRGTDKVQIANLDGSQVEEAFIQNIKNPNKIALFIIPKDSLVIQGDQKTCINDTKEYTCTLENVKSYYWKVSKGKIIGKEDSSLVKIHWDEPGEGSIQIQVLSNFGISDSLTQNVEIFPNPQPQIIGNFVICEENPQIETYSYPQANTQNLFNWVVEGGSILTGQGTPQIEVKWEKTQNPSIAIIETLPQLDCSGQFTQAITFVKPTLKIITENTQPQICDKEAIKLIPEIPIETSKFLWYKEGIQEPISDGTFLFVNEPGVYRVSAQTNCGLIQSEQLLLEAGDVFVPNLFSPNGDGNNDRFTVCVNYPDQIQRIELQVFDKYGNQVFSSTQKEDILCREQVQEGGWDGGESPSDTYVWMLKVVFSKCGEKNEKGLVKLTR